MKLKLFISFFTLSFFVFSQIRFEKGYFITNNGKTVDGYIKNIDWANNPKEFEFKSTELSEIEIKDLNNVIEFGITDEFTYKKYTIDIDRSSENLNNYSHVKNPEFSKETVFLKLLVDGNIDLLVYQETNFLRFFFQIGDNLPEQLIYKKYYVNQSLIATNEHFKNQIQKNILCQENSKNSIQNLNYLKNDLIKYFRNYNECIGSEITTVKNNNQKSDFNLNLKLGANFSSLEIHNQLIATSKDTEFEKKTSLSVGLEFEYIFPFNKNKWAVVFEPNYRNYESEGKSHLSNKISKAKYNSIELPVGFRHYFFLGEKSKIFLNAFFVWDANLNSEIVFQELTKLDVHSQSNYAFGVGYNYDKYFIELRYYTKRRILQDYIAWESDFQNLNMTIGYKIF